MRILFDQGVPVPLRSYLSPHNIDTAYEKGWSELQNGNLLKAAEADAYEVFLTTDQNLQYEQNLSARSISVVILSTTSWPRIKLATAAVLSAIESACPGQFTVVDIPRR